MNLTGVNDNVIMSGWVDDNPDHERQKRLEIIQRVYRNELTVVEAALVMGLSERQCYRIKARVDKAGAKGGGGVTARRSEPFNPQANTDPLKMSRRVGNQLHQLYSLAD